jgi:CSLREA domain-containing protein
VLVLVLTGLVGPARPVQAATFTVDTLADTVDVRPGDGVCADAGGRCSLRAAVMEANALGGGPHTIVLGAGQTYTLSRDADGGGHAVDSGADNDDLDITANITIQGNGATIQRDPSLPCTVNDTQTGEFRIFAVHPGGRLELQTVTVRNGCAPEYRGTGGIESYGGGILNLGTLLLTGATIGENQAAFGGGLYNAGGTLTISNSTISANRVTAQCGGLANSYGTVSLIGSVVAQNTSVSAAGGICNTGNPFIMPAVSAQAIATLTIKDSRIVENQGNAGGIVNDALLTIERSAISQNRGSDRGGGIWNLYELQVVQSTLAGNQAFLGGAIFNAGGARASILDSTIAGNSADAAIYNSGVLTIVNSTITGNAARTAGGGVNNYGTVQASFVTISGNTANGDGGGIYNRSGGTFNLRNAIVANNTRQNCFGSGTFHTSGVNFATDATCPGFTLVTSAQLNLQPLADNGGPTPTHALGPGSVAIDAVSDCTDLNNTPVRTDQRGVARPQGVRCDAGAFEREGVRRAFWRYLPLVVRGR